MNNILIILFGLLFAFASAVLLLTLTVSDASNGIVILAQAICITATTASGYALYHLLKWDTQSRQTRTRRDYK